MRRTEGSLGVALVSQDAEGLCVSDTSRKRQESMSRISAADLWEASPVVISHTHIDPSNTPPTTDALERSIDELVTAGVTTAILSLAIDDGDYGSDWPPAPPTPNESSYFPYAIGDPSFGTRFDFRLTRLETLEAGGKIKIVKSIKDIPQNAAEVKEVRREKILTVIIGSEGSNHFAGPLAMYSPTPSDVLARDLSFKTASVKSIAAYKERGWLCSALCHSQQVEHRLLSKTPPIPLSTWTTLNDYGRFITMLFAASGILIDMPHLDPNMANEIMDIADMAKRPVMISHDNPNTNKGGDLQYYTSATRLRIAQSGGNTGVIGIHSAAGYFVPQGTPPPYPNPSINDYAEAIEMSRQTLQGDGVAKGDEHIALGLDWYFTKWMNVKQWAGRDPNDPLKDLVPIFQGSSYNYSDAQIQNILGLNMIRLLDAAWK